MTATDYRLDVVLEHYWPTETRWTWAETGTSRFATMTHVAGFPLTYRLNSPVDQPIASVAACRRMISLVAGGRRIMAPNGRVLFDPRALTGVKALFGTGGNDSDPPLELSAYRFAPGTGAYRHSVESDIAEAVHRDHACEDRGCDIREAAENGFPLIAARMLVNATETDYTERLLRLYGVDPNMYNLPGWERWADHHATYGVKCDACNSYTYGDSDWMPSKCSNCLAPLIYDNCPMCHSALNDDDECGECGWTQDA